MKKRNQGRHAHKKQWLLSYREMIEKAEYEISQAEYWRDKAIGLSTRLLKLAPSKGGNPIELDDCVIEFLQYSEQSKLYSEEANRRRQEIEDAIDAVKDTECRRLLKLHYIKGLNLSEIADQMHYSLSWIKQLHLQALDLLTIPKETDE